MSQVEGNRARGAVRLGRHWVVFAAYAQCKQPIFAPIVLEELGDRRQLVRVEDLTAACGEFFVRPIRYAGDAYRWVVGCVKRER